MSANESPTAPANPVTESVQHMLEPILAPLLERMPGGDWVHALILIGGLLVAALVIDWLTQRILRPLVVRAASATRTRIDDIVLQRGVLKRLAHVVPALVVYFGITVVPNVHNVLATGIGKAAQVYIVLNIAMAVSAFLSAFNDLYERRPNARNRPIKGYIQLVKMIVYIVAFIIIVAALFDRSPLTMLAGLGAMGAVLMLVFKDTILSLVASVQIASNDMIRVGDWIQMPSQGVDGDVIDIALHTVKVQNFDKTIVTVPTHKLIEEGVKNWRGMSESGGRRIKRALFLDQASVHFLDDDERQKLQRFALLQRHFERKHKELAEWNAEKTDRAVDPVNTRRLTNLGCFRAYIAAYLESHPKLDHGKTLMVRQLAPGSTGLPLEIYCFTATTEWGTYESIQADIFDHLLAILPEFDLRLFQEVSGADLVAGLGELRDTVVSGSRG